MNCQLMSHKEAGVVIIFLM